MNPDRTVALFITCLTDQFYPRVGIAVVKVLERLGWKVVFPREQTCCGQPFFNNGYHADAKKLARLFIETFEPYPYVVTPSGSCCAMARQQFHELLHDDPLWSPRVNALRNKTYEFVEFLERVQQFDPAGLSYPKPLSVAYHYTCHLRHLGITDQSVRLLNSVADVRVQPPEKADQCCGFGGTFALKYPQISRVMVEDKVQNIRASGADVAICNDAGCTMNIAGLCNRQHVPTRLMHIAELLAESMGLAIEEL